MICRIAFVALLAATQALAEVKTFCNPVNLDYGVNYTKSGDGYRHGADPVIVLYKDRYWLFSTWDKPGYRVSDDLVHWTYIPFQGVDFERKEYYTAAAVAQVGDYLYFIELSRNPVFFYRTKDPASGKWEKVVQAGPYADPCLFVDPPTGRVFVTHGLEKPVHIVELDRTTLKELPGTDKELMPAYVPGTPITNGWEVCTWDNSEASKGMRGNKTFNPCREGSWVTFYKGKYYLQYASPGTTVPGYADGLLTSDSPTGPFAYSNFSPISQKASGFITSAGHSCLFQDRYGNWWRAVTQLIGVHDRFERRVGLFPAGFDDDGIPYTRTDAGETPIYVPDAKRDFTANVGPEWAVLSQGKPVIASSWSEGHETALASDEDVRTWWAARTGEKGEWLRVDLGKALEVRAVQVNLAEEGYQKTKGEDLHRFLIEGSVDGDKWETILDARKNDTASPHRYVQLERATKVRYVRVTNEFTPGGGKFAVSDLRVFGVGEGPEPAMVSGVKAERDAKDRRKVTIRWSPAKDATGYVVRYGIDKEKWYQHHIVRGGSTAELTLYSLNAEPSYFFRVDATNEAGVTEGTEAAEAK